MKRRIIIVIAFLFLFSACSMQQPAAKAGPIEILSPWARQAIAMGEGMGGSNGAAYMIIRNSAAEADRLMKVESSASMTAEMHQTTMNGDVMSMSPVEAIEIPARGQVELKPGGYHIMMMDLKQDLKAGETITLTLTFEKAGILQVATPVKDQ